MKQLRQSSGLSQEKFAQKVGVSVGTVSRWERGAFTPSSLAEERLKQLADVFPGDNG